jgi:hypothetical protein
MRAARPGIASAPRISTNNRRAATGPETDLTRCEGVGHQHVGRDKNVTRTALAAALHDSRRCHVILAGLSDNKIRNGISAAIAWLPRTREPFTGPALPPACAPPRLGEVARSKPDLTCPRALRHERAFNAAATTAGAGWPSGQALERDLWDR